MERAENDVLVSVIVPAYNAEKYLRECLMHMMEQTLSQWELILVDDGSTDATLQIAGEMAERDERIKIVSTRHAGVSEARNTGVRRAKGTYLYFHDADDWLEADGLEKMVEAFPDEETEAVLFDAISFCDPEEESEDFERYRDYYGRGTDYSGVVGGVHLMDAMLRNEEYRVACYMQMVRRDFFLNNELWFQKGIIFEDNLYSYKLMLTGDRIRYIPQVFYHRRVHGNSIVTGRPALEKAYGYYRVFLEMRDFYRDRAAAKRELIPPRLQWAPNEIMHRMLQNAREQYRLLDDEEASRYHQLDEHDRMMFEVLVVIPEQYRTARDESKARLKQAWEEKTECNRRLQETYAEKSEINRKLQETYAEKSEINRKLQETYAEKSEINRKLQITYREKSEINRALKACREEREALKRQIRELEGDNAALKESREYRLGLALTKPVRAMGKKRRNGEE